MWRVEMYEDGRWVTLGGRYDAMTADERMLQFQSCYMGAVAKNCMPTLKRTFRVVREDGGSRFNRPSGAKAESFAERLERERRTS